MSETCSRCGSPLGGTIHPSDDGDVCHSCFNPGEDVSLGVVTNWHYDEQTGRLILKTQAGQPVKVSCSEEQAEEMGHIFLGLEVEDLGDQWTVRGVKNARFYHE